MPEDRYIMPSFAQPEWFTELRKQKHAGKSLFLIDFNVRDYVFIPGKENAPRWLEKEQKGSIKAAADEQVPLLRVRDWILSRLVPLFDVVLFYSLTEGLRAYGAAGGLIFNEEDKQFFLEDSKLINLADKKESLSRRLDQPLTGTKIASRITDIYEEAVKNVVEMEPDLIELLSHPLSKEALPYSLDISTVMRVLNRLLTVPMKIGTKPVRIALVFDGMEQLAPSDTGGRGLGQGERLVIEMTQQWAIEPHIASLGHTVIMLTDDINSVHPSLYAANSSIFRINLPTPNANQGRQ